MTTSLPFRAMQGQPAPTTKEPSLPRVLFVSVNPFSTTANNGKTFASFFKGYPADSLAQLYFHRELPTSPVCHQYYRITDEDLLRDLLRPWRITGDQVRADATAASFISGKAHSALKASQVARLMRQVLWTQVRLDNRKLLAWLDDFAPEVVLFCGGDAAALYPKVTALAQRSGAKLVLYITDDYVLPSTSRNLPARAQRLWNRRVLRGLTAGADLILTIGEAMSQRYKEEFDFDSVPVMNMVDVPEVRPASRLTPASPDHPLTLLYAGGFHSNRWQVLAKIGESIARLADRGVPVRLRIHGPEPTKTEHAAIHHPPWAEYCGLLSPEELRHAVDEADVLVHVESDDPDSMVATALSISTKIPEYLASGRSILAIGPRQVASMKYLSAHDVATVLEPGDPTGLDHALERLALQPGVSSELAERGFQLAQANHEGGRTRHMLWDRLQGLVR